VSGKTRRIRRQTIKRALENGRREEDENHKVPPYGMSFKMG
jgi:hypothetical protein